MFMIIFIAMFFFGYGVGNLMRRMVYTQQKTKISTLSVSHNRENTPVKNNVEYDQLVGS